MNNTDFSKLIRNIHPIPDFVKKELKENNLLNVYQARPPYQQNDYIGWINRAKRQETKEKRLKQMLAELEDSSLYMNMKYNPK